MEDTLTNLEPNKVLNTRPPEIDKEEQSLSRKARSELVRLRSVYSHRLRQNMSRIDEEVQDNCSPLCNATPHDTAHLFSWSANLTELTVTNLWTKPKEAAEFLQLDEDDDQA